MKSNMITKMIVTCLCIWAIGMAADTNEEIKSIEKVEKGVNSLTKAEYNAKMHADKKGVKSAKIQKKTTINENTLETKQMKDRAYKNAKREAAMQSEKKALSYKIAKRIDSKKEISYKVAKRTDSKKAISYGYEKRLVALKNIQPLDNPSEHRDCVDTDNGATDPYGDGCAAYNNYPSWCGNYDDDDFQSNDMCCVCGGGDGGSEPEGCADGEFDCGDGNCIPGSWECDVYWCDCADCSDEADCGGRSDGSTGKQKPIIKGLKNPNDVIKHEASLGRKASGFKSSLHPANSVKLIQSTEGLSYEADGFVGFEITLSHGADFEINVTDAGFIADYNTVGNTTKVVVVNNETNELFTSTGDFEIVDVIAATAGVLVRPDLPGEWATAMGDLSDDRRHRRQLAQAGREAVAGLTWDLIADRQEAVYQGVGL